MAEITTMGRAEAEKTPGRADTHVISICSPGEDTPTLQSGWGHVTRVQMRDDDGPPPLPALVAIGAAIVRAHAAHAHLLIHCGAGVSRSVGVARAASQVLGWTYGSRFHGNAVIKNALLQHLGVRITSATSLFRED